jgi:hypothetical protein
MADYVPVTGGRALAQSQDLLANRPRQNAKAVSASMAFVVAVLAVCSELLSVRQIP